MAAKQGQDKSRDEKLIQQYTSRKGNRTNMEGYWQTLHDYFYIEAENVNQSFLPGSELNVSYLWDSTTLEASDVLAAGFMSYLTPPTSRWFSLKPRNPLYRDNKRVTSYFEDVADEVNAALNRSNFYSQINAVYKSSGVYGTAVLHAEEDIEDDIRFYQVPIKNIVLVEDAKGRVNGYFIEHEFTSTQAAEKFGIDKLSNEMKQELDQDKVCTKKWLFVLYISKRYARDDQKQTKQHMQIEASWIDVAAKTTIDEGGYHEMPCMAHRFDKRPFVEWGFSPAMKALPWARTLNAIAKTNLRSMMKHTDPPIAVPDNAFLLPFDANPRATNFYNQAKMPNGSKDIFAFGNFGNPEVGMKALAYYQAMVKQAMYNDVFLAFNGITKDMNNPEVYERINEKMTLLGPAVGRYISDINNPVIIRTIGILHRKGRLPKPPDELRNDPGYEIDCISQLAVSQRRSELNALLQGLQLAGQISTFKPEVLDRISGDKTLDEAWDILGAPTRVFNDDVEVQKIREARGKAAQAQQQLALAQQGADVIKAGSEVDANLSKAGK